MIKRTANIQVFVSVYPLKHLSILLFSATRELGDEIIVKRKFINCQTFAKQETNSTHCYEDSLFLFLFFLTGKIKTVIN